MIRPLLILFLLTALAPAADVTLAWDANAEPGVSYRLSYGTAPGALLTSLTTTTQTQQTVTGLAPGTTYHFAVVAIVQGLVSAPSEVVTYTVAKAPSAPKNLRIVEIQTSANLKDWETIAMIPQDPSKAPANFVRARVTTLPLPEN